MKTARINLVYRLPYDWKALLAWFRFHQIPDLEEIDDDGYARVIRTANGLGWFWVVQIAKQHLLELRVAGATKAELPGLERAVRRMFDLNAEPNTIGRAMAKDAQLGKLWAQYPGLRVARAWSGYESIMTTILGQLVSMSFGRTLVHELMVAAGSKDHHPRTGTLIHLFPTPEQLVAADLSAVRAAPMRRKAIQAAAKMAVEGALDWEKPTDPNVLRKTLLSIPGIGVWTAEYVAMRGFHDDDAFPTTDYALKRELAKRSGMKVELVRPWRAYAAAALWRSYLAEQDEAL